MPKKTGSVTSARRAKRKSTPRKKAPLISENSKSVSTLFKSGNSSAAVGPAGAGPGGAARKRKARTPRKPRKR